MAHPELQSLLIRLQKIHESLYNFKPLAARPLILDSSLEAGGQDATDDGQWLQQENIPGLKKLRESVKLDLDVLEKFLNDPKSANLPPLSTNAAYLIAVYNEVLCASKAVAIFKTLPLAPIDMSLERPQRRLQKASGAKVDVVADNGRRWIRVNTIKNSRILAEFREIDSYLTDSEDDEDEGGSDSDGLEHRPSLAQTEFDNSVLRMGRTLLAAAKANPIEGTDEIPRVVLRLTRLDPSPTRQNGEKNDPRIAQTIQCLTDMGIEVERGERPEDEVPNPEQTASPAANPTALLPTANINLDLSVIIALVSELTHSALPNTADEAVARFVPPQRYREWRQQRKDKKGRGGSSDIPETVEDFPEDLAKHTRALTNQVLQEMVKGLFQEMHDRLSPLLSSPGKTIQFWTTPEARDRCLRIIDKIGGEAEKRRAHALFPAESTSNAQAEEMFWRDSRFPRQIIPLLPIHIHPSSEPESGPMANSTSVSVPASPTALPRFFKSLGKTCKDILAQEDGDDASAAPSGGIDEGESGEHLQRATVTKANPRLTAHTVKSMLWGAELGWTTLTANRTSVKAMLREMKAARIAGRLEELGTGEGEEGVQGEAAIWVVDPRSLAEGMRADGS